jgi:hypothetical protein
MRRRIIRFQISRPGVRPDHLGLRCSIRLPPWAMEHRPVVVSRGRHPGNASATAAPDPPGSRIPERRPRLRCHSIAAWPSPPGVRIGCRPASGDEPAKWPAWPPYRTTRGASAYGPAMPRRLPRRRGIVLSAAAARHFGFLCPDVPISGDGGGSRRSYGGLDLVEGGLASTGAPPHVDAARARLTTPAGHGELAGAAMFPNPADARPDKRT